VTREDAKLPKGGNHALLIGTVLGALQGVGLLEAMPVMDEGRYTDTLVITRPSGTWLLRIAPEDVIET
jgi:hypothetical protein